MAPEVIELKGASTKSDIWSLGCTLVELVTGKPPYADMIAMSAMFHIVEDPCPPLPESLSDDMKQFLTSCFHKDPELRPSATELKQHPWILNNKKLKKTETYAHDLKKLYREEEEVSTFDQPYDVKRSKILPNIYITEKFYRELLLLIKDIVWRVQAVYLFN